MPFQLEQGLQLKSDLPKRQLEAYNHFVTALHTHPHVHNVLLKGSLDGGGDEWSDVDLHILCDEARISDVFNDCWQLVAKFRKVLLIEEVQFSLRQIVVIYENHLHVDLYIGPLMESPKVNSDTHEKERIEALNHALYTFHELDIALKRGDYLWAQRLTSHLIAYLCLDLCATYIPNQPHLHLKNLQQHLPKEVATEIRQIQHHWGVENYQAGLQGLISLAAKRLHELPPKVHDQLRHHYFEYFATWPERYGSRYHKKQTIPVEEVKTWVLSTSCYRIRPIHLGDAPMLLSLLNSPGWLKYIGDRQVHSLDDAKAYIERIHSMSNVGYWVIETDPQVETYDDNCPEQRSHGVLTLLQREHLQLPDLGFALLPESYGKGIALDVSINLIAHLREHRAFRGLLAIVLPENVASQKLLLRLGFKPWGTEAKDGETLIKYQLD